MSHCPFTIGVQGAVGKSSQSTSNLMPDPGKEWSWKQNLLTAFSVSSSMPVFTDLSESRLIFQKKISKAVGLHPKPTKIVSVAL